MGTFICLSPWGSAAQNIIIFLALNISRIVFVNGLNRILWRAVYTGNFSYLGASDLTGHTKYNHEKLKERLHSTLKWFQLKGVAMVLFAFAINVPWVVGIRYAVDSLPHASGIN